MRREITRDNAYDVLGSGDYGKDEYGDWWVCLPKVINQECKPICRLTGNGKAANWDITEHEDKTITVSPSINMQGFWHGHLVKGVWKEC